MLGDSPINVYTIHNTLQIDTLYTDTINDIGLPKSELIEIR